MRIFWQFLLTWLLSAFCVLASAQSPPLLRFPGSTPPKGAPVTILALNVDPVESQAGESVTLRWDVLNAYSISIEPDIGAVATRGSRDLSPEVTTTYTLTATGADGAKTQSVTVTVPGTTPRVAGNVQAQAALPVPRQSDGKPDLSGLYLTEGGLTRVGEVKLVPGAESFRVQTAADDLGQSAKCVPLGIIGQMGLPFPFQIVQRPDGLAIAYEGNHQFRIIPIGGEHAEYLPPAYMGHSVAHWDADTLVVDVRGLNDKTLVTGYRHTEDMRITERFRRSSHGAIDYEATVEDPNVFAEPLRFRGTLRLHPEWTISEHYCSENALDYEEKFEKK